MLIGAECFYFMLLNRNVSLDSDFPTLQNIALAWMISGLQSLQKSSVSCYFSTSDLQNSLSFGKLRNHIMSLKYCEENFVKTTKRNYYRRFVVEIPFKSNTSLLRDSKQSALNIFFSLERKL